MTGTWTRLESTVAFLLRDDVDTDTIIPQTEVLSSGKSGLAAGLFAHWRREPGFVLNERCYQGTRIIGAGRNFGCGSSREHAAWALADFGVGCILAPSFGPIFYRNCLRSRIAPLVLAAGVLAEIRAELGEPPEPSRLLVDLDAGVLRARRRTWPVEVPAQVVDYVMRGLDEIDRTDRTEAAITRYEQARPPLPVKVAGRYPPDYLRNERS